jgi:hypothetical protein
LLIFDPFQAQIPLLFVMQPQTIRRFIAVTMIALGVCCSSVRASDNIPIHKTANSKRLQLYRSRQSDNDLEVTGLINGLPPGAIGYVHYADLLALPQFSFQAQADENFAELRPKQKVEISGIYLDATCVDSYRGHYPNTYVAEHRPVLALAIDRLPTAAWARKAKQASLGPYFITYAHFTPAFKVLSHIDQAQLPSNIIRINFTTSASTFGSITPRGNFLPGSPEQHGFTIAKQNCLRCHNQGQAGGGKSGRDWLILGTWAREQPAYFANYVHNPQAFETKAKMPGNAQYDAATLAAITAYFRTFADITSSTDHP